MTSNSTAQEIALVPALSEFNQTQLVPRIPSIVDMGENSTELVEDIGTTVASTEGILVRGTVSTTNSVSSTSTGVHAFGPLSKIEDDETFDGCPPTKSESVAVEVARIEDSPMYTKAVVAHRKLPLTSKAKRSVSEVEAELECSKQPSNPKKKARSSSAAVEDSLPSRTIGSNPPVLLAQPQDESVLNPIHCFVRKQIEVFEATEVEIQLPAPGRKIPIRPKQIGLRCIHCKNLAPRDRVKRAVCYPTSVGRVYHSVSDMKFDHFSTCKGLTGQNRQEFDRLKEDTRKGKGGAKKTSKKSSKNLKYSSSTAQYYHDTAIKMGMRDGDGGVYYSSLDIFSSRDQYPSPSNEPPPMSQDSVSCTQKRRSSDILPTEHSSTSSPLRNTSLPAALSIAGVNTDGIFSQLSTLPLSSSLASELLQQHHFFSYALQQQMLLSLMANQSLTGGDPSSDAKVSAIENTDKVIATHEGTEEKETLPTVKKATFHASSTTKTNTSDTNTKTDGSMMLCSPLDSDYLNPIHCFVRRHVEVFAASEADVSAPAPGRKTRILLGQVGLRCIHCKSIPSKQRVKRAFCFPKTVSGIYHAVSNMKFDHFGKCGGLPAKERAEFNLLREACSRRSSTSTGTGMTNTTAQFYHDSALRMGLVDTAEGIRLRGDGDHDSSSQNLHESAIQEEVARPARSSPVGDGISALIIAASDSASDTENSTQEVKI